MILAKIKLRIGDNEIEVDSRDFYVDNKTIGEVIENIAAHLQTKNVRIITGDFPVQDNIQEVHALNSLENAEVYEPEFSNPTSVPPKELRGKLLILSKNYFFDTIKNLFLKRMPSFCFCLVPHLLQFHPIFSIFS